MSGAGAAAWGLLVEPRLFALRRVDAPVLTPGSAPIRVLHLTDLHLLPTQHRKIAWTAALADLPPELRPDLVINTGDTLSAPDAVPAAVEAFGRLLDLPGGFVHGNNDYTAPMRRSPHRYFQPRRPSVKGPPLPWRALAAAQAARGWIDLNNHRQTIEVAGQRIGLAGIADSFTRRDRYPAIAGPADDTAAVRIGVLHTPEPASLDKFAGDGYDLLLAGHTHGGQVRVPGIGALVTNCGIDRSRARGLSRWGARSWLHVSAGLGANPYLDLRFCCRPEATLLTLVPRAAARGTGAGSVSRAVAWSGGEAPIG